MNRAVFFMMLSLVGFSFVGNAISGNRQDVYRVLDGINGNWREVSTAVMVNGRGPGATVMLGDRISYSLEATKPGFFSLLHVDSHGSVTVIQPRTGDKPRQQLVYPQEIELVAEPPLGKETLLVVVSKSEIAPAVLGLIGENEIARGDDPVQMAKGFAAAVAEARKTGQVGVARIEYYVEGMVGMTQYTARGIVREFSDDSASPAEAAERVSEARIENSAGIPASGDSMNKTVELQMLQFEFNSADLTSKGMLNLDVFGEAFLSSELKDQKYRVEGHTDDVGPSVYNWDLSMRRAQTARQYLVENFGIDGNRLQVTGYGETRPMMPNDNAVQRAGNRRVVFRRIQ